MELIYWVMFVAFMSHPFFTLFFHVRYFFHRTLPNMLKAFYFQLIINPLQ